MVGLRIRDVRTRRLRGLIEEHSKGRSWPMLNAPTSGLPTPLRTFLGVDARGWGASSVRASSRQREMYEVDAEHFSRAAVLGNCRARGVHRDHGRRLSRHPHHGPSTEERRLVRC